MTEERYWALSLSIPVVVPGAPLVLFSLFGAPEWWVHGPDNLFKAAIGMLLASLPFCVPLYAPMAVIALLALRSRGTAWVPRWLILGPLVYAGFFTLVFNGIAGIEFSPTVLAFVLVVAYSYAALASLGHWLIFGWRPATHSC